MLPMAGFPLTYLGKWLATSWVKLIATAHSAPSPNVFKLN